MIRIIVAIWPVRDWFRLRLEDTVCDYAVMVGPFWLIIHKQEFGA